MKIIKYHKNIKHIVKSVNFGSQTALCLMLHVSVGYGSDFDRAFNTMSVFSNKLKTFMISYFDSISRGERTYRNMNLSWRISTMEWEMDGQTSSVSNIIFQEKNY